MLNYIESYLIYPFEKIRRKIPTREKYLNTVIFTFLALSAAEIPLVGTMKKENLSEVTFKVSGTLMQLGTQPFVFASMVAPLLLDQDNEQGTNIIGFIISIFMALQWGIAEYNWVATVQLCFVAYLLLQSEVYLKERGAISPSTALIFANASKRIILSLFVDPLSFIWAIVLMISVAWIENINITVPLTHTRSRMQTISMELPVMYNSTTALIMYYTFIEILSSIWTPAQILLSRNISRDTFITAPILYICVYFINSKLASFNNQTGKDMIQRWKKQKLTLKGWRDPKKMYKYVQNIIDRNVKWNTIFICGLWTLGILYRPSVGITTLFILVGTIKRNRPTWQLF